MSNLEELEVKNVCSLSCDAPTNMCSLLGDHTCGACCISLPCGQIRHCNQWQLLACLWD